MVGGVNLVHGGDIYTQGVLKGVLLTDFSSNINPLGVPLSFRENIEEAVNNCERYPDIKYREVLNSLKDYTGIDKEYFVLGNGAAEIIDLSISCFKSIVIVVPSFLEYELDAKRQGLSIEYSSLLKEDMEYDYEDILKKMEKSEALIIGNPNNPNGSVIDQDKFKDILDYCEEKGKKIIIDEAFIEFVGDREKSFTKYLEKYSCLFIIRALTKFFGMPGIRFGYGLSGDSSFLKKVRDRQNPWNINCFAETAVKYVLKDQKYIEKSLKWIVEERKYMTTELKKLSFIDKVFDTKANFLLIKLKNKDIQKLYDYCLSSGILIRKCDNFRGLDEHYVRFAVKDREKNNKLLSVLKNFNLDY
ncbi:pyridoxal phosphate-dependent aminotransferase [Haloimpatiens sp. FM7315]|uniref:pyridoxal phosphate-dependent aminotransferase n=1 Tax=Haloimpatiens sp. FM7315 TaxID=3298609 RepID=UPI00370CAE14